MLCAPEINAWRLNKKLYFLVFTLSYISTIRYIYRSWLTHLTLHRLHCKCLLYKRLRFNQVTAPQSMHSAPEIMSLAWRKKKYVLFLSLQYLFFSVRFLFRSWLTHLTLHLCSRGELCSGTCAFTSIHYHFQSACSCHTLVMMSALHTVSSNAQICLNCCYITSMCPDAWNDYDLGLLGLRTFGFKMFRAFGF